MHQPNVSTLKAIVTKAHAANVLYYAAVVASAAVTVPSTSPSTADVAVGNISLSAQRFGQFQRTHDSALWRTHDTALQTRACQPSTISTVDAFGFTPSQTASDDTSYGADFHTTSGHAGITTVGQLNAAQSPLHPSPDALSPPLAPTRSSPLPSAPPLPPPPPPPIFLCEVCDEVELSAPKLIEVISSVVVALCLFISVFTAGGFVAVI
eukprot:CAMPEP_0119338190 /NCGR_PEP_ID=MMETSP1333-20130426/95547_1 /TAXON_ID=418940 /ORGANISM="Scyphosphaera apsteinii, Strain RCC1455" /LENGTH=208 /DNA_ID=CAMNT_0007349409 /DNA_START=141 /DNA_END=765 /DNA_ORIENTATION=+